MRLLRVCPAGLFGYGPHVPIDLDNRGVVLFQGPVGEGKSSVLDALTEVLYGTSPRRDGIKDVVPADTVNRTFKKVFSWVEAEAGGHRYRVIYVRDWKDAPLTVEPSAQIDEAGGYLGTSVYFERWDGQRWVQKGIDGRDLRYAKMADTYARIVEVLGVDYTSFCSVAYVPQNKALQFIQGKNAEREEILTKLLGLGVYDDAEAVAKEQKAIADRAHITVSAQANALGPAIEAFRPVGKLEDYQGAVDAAIRAEQAVATKMAELQANVEKAQEETSFLTMSLKVHRQRLSEVSSSIESTLGAAQRTMQVNHENAQRAWSVALAAIPRSTPDLDAAVQAVSDCVAMVNAERRHLQSMMPGAGRCPSCGSVLDVDTLSRHRAQQSAKLEAAEVEMRAASERARIAKAEFEERKTRDTERIQAELKVRVADAEAKAALAAQGVLSLDAEKAQLQRQVTEAEASILAASNYSAAKELAALSGEHGRLARDRVAAENALSIFEQRQAERVKIEASRAELERAVAKAKLDVDEWGWLIKQFPRVKQLKFAAGSEKLNARIAHYLGLLTDGRTSVTLHPYHLKREAARKPLAQRSADDYVFEFSMIVEEDGKEGVPIQLYSGGERQEITLAMLPAFSDVAADRGTACNVLLLDEAMSFLNEAAIERVVRMLDDVRSRVGTIVLICHDPALANLLRYDESWYARKSRGMTTIEVTR